jgi:thiamine pyrophosphate-dependent acetolactate synthase large subunit-like protein
MHNWADTFFKGRRLDTPEDTGDGTLNLKKIANAFDLKHYLITNTKKINSDIKNILSIKGPVFVEVITDHNQKIFDAFKDY